jgi:hypothetical protein
VIQKLLESACSRNLKKHVLEKQTGEILGCCKQSLVGSFWAAQKTRILIGMWIGTRDGGMSLETKAGRLRI